MLHVLIERIDWTLPNPLLSLTAGFEHPTITYCPNFYLRGSKKTVKSCFATPNLVQ